MQMQPVQMQQVQPVYQQQVVQAPQPQQQQPQQYNQNNEIFKNVGGPNFAILPRVEEFEEPCGCCSDKPRMLHGMHIVPSPGRLTMHHQAVSFAQGVMAAHANGQKTGLSSDLRPETCLWRVFQKEMFHKQEFKDKEGKILFTVDQALRCGCIRHGPLRVHGPDGETEWGRLEFGQMGWCDQLQTILCLMIARTPEIDEWPYLIAVDENGVEKMTFRHPKQEGRCLFDQRVHAGKKEKGPCAMLCGDLPNDKRIHQKHAIYGPMGESNPIGSIEVRGATGYDNLGCCKIVHGIRPELVANVSLPPGMSTKNAALATFMALYQMKDVRTVMDEDRAAGDTDGDGEVELSDITANQQQAKHESSGRLGWLRPTPGPGQQSMS